MSRNTTPPGSMGADARHGIPNAGAENAVGINKDMRQPEVPTSLDDGPNITENNTYRRATYKLGKRPRASKAFIRMDR
jgi:hypothetical protein